MIKDAYPLPLISDLIVKVKDATIFTKFDTRSGYNNIRIKDSDQWKATFITSKGLFKPTVMFFGPSNSPTTFQRFMNNSFKDMIAEGWLIVYMDDMLITASNKQTNIEWTKRVLQRMKELNLHLKLKKCKFGVTEVDFLRAHTLTQRNCHGLNCQESQTGQPPPRSKMLDCFWDLPIITNDSLETTPT